MAANNIIAVFMSKKPMKIEDEKDRLGTNTSVLQQYICDLRIIESSIFILRLEFSNSKSAKQEHLQLYIWRYRQTWKGKFP